jgi:hypothetical protein
MKKQNTIKLALEALDHEDDEILALQEQKAQIERVKQEQEKARLDVERWKTYFFMDNTCKEHDRYGCRECRHYATGGCPSYWEERY